MPALVFRKGEPRNTAPIIESAVPAHLRFPSAPNGQRHWRDLPNVFSRAREAGVNGAVVGWYLPYPRLLGSVTVDSWWFDNRTSDAATGDRLWDMLLNNPRTLIETSLLSPFGQSLLTKRRVRMFHEFMAKTHELLNDDRVGLLLLHVPVPHTPYFYDRQSGQNSLSNSTIDGYWDALALVDRIVGELRTQMMWGNGTIRSFWSAPTITIGRPSVWTDMWITGCPSC